MKRFVTLLFTLFILSSTVFSVSAASMPEAYKPIMDQYINGFKDPDNFDQGSLGVFNDIWKYPDNMNNDGFILMDLNGDGTPELLTGELKQYDNGTGIFCIFSTKDGKANHIVQKFAADRALKILPRDNGNYFITQGKTLITPPPGITDDGHSIGLRIAYYDIQNGEYKFDHFLTTFKGQTWYSDNPDEVYQRQVDYQKLNDNGLQLPLTSFANYDPNNVTVYEPSNTPDPSPSTPTHPTGDKVEIYRLYNLITGEHLYTPDKTEVQALVQNNWRDEGIGWVSSSTGTPVYRLYNPETKFHLFTTDENEKNVLTSQQGWSADNGGNPLFYSEGNVSIYRLYNPGTREHLLTRDENEYNTLGENGWNKEGVKLTCVE